MEFNRPDVVERYADIIEEIDLVAVHESRYDWGKTAHRVMEIAPEMTREDRNVLVPVICGLAFDQYGFHGGCSVLQG